MKNGEAEKGQILKNINKKQISRAYIQNLETENLYEFWNRRIATEYRETVGNAMSRLILVNR